MRLPIEPIRYGSSTCLSILTFRCKCVFKDYLWRTFIYFDNNYFYYYLFTSWNFDNRELDPQIPPYLHHCLDNLIYQSLKCIRLLQYYYLIYKFYKFRWQYTHNKIHVKYYIRRAWLSWRSTKKISAVQIMDHFFEFLRMLIYIIVSCLEYNR
jgi:hypothetical protein